MFVLLSIVDFGGREKFIIKGSLQLQCVAFWGAKIFFLDKLHCHCDGVTLNTIENIFRFRKTTIVSF